MACAHWSSCWKPSLHGTHMHGAQMYRLNFYLFSLHSLICSSLTDNLYIKTLYIQWGNMCVCTIINLFSCRSSPHSEKLHVSHAFEHCYFEQLHRITLRWLKMCLHVRLAAVIVVVALSLLQMRWWSCCCCNRVVVVAVKVVS